ncbi:hypothetical protein IU486_15055 [Streptomyces gardneri]|uniref:hypothetical protein n=1 Tax=Nocardia TaxID=1817 RepID=UPI00135C700C|nr:MULTISPECIES: hypothetical protein [Nocardia]MBF6166089.1 hypothetical protein [Streptomyces gardneri]MBF6207088.1 hypothetical protein [Streptomyces gardneri]UAK31794.1 hypothetical protein K8O92_29270 [Nocardia asteroides]
MRVNRFAATALLAVGATGIATGVAHAQPATPAQVSVHGVEQGIGFTSAPAADGTGVVTTLDAGSFALTADARAVELRDGAGQVVATVPLAFQASGATHGLAPAISDAGRTLTVTPVGAPAVTERLTQINEDETLARKQHNAGVGALIGAGIGAVIGFFLGGVGALVTIPIGAGIGALIGFSTP